MEQESRVVLLSLLYWNDDAARFRVTDIAVDRYTSTRLRRLRVAYESVVEAKELAGRLNQEFDVDRPLTEVIPTGNHAFRPMREGAHEDGEPASA